MIFPFNSMLNNIKVGCVKNNMPSTCAQRSFRDNYIKCKGVLCKECVWFESGNYYCTECLPETSEVVSKKTTKQPSKSSLEKKEKQD